MKRNARHVATLILGIFASLQLSAQCEPDTLNCEDIGEPGQICPLVLPKAGLNTLYDEVVTIIPPGSFYFWGNELSIFYIEIDSIKNLPPGIDYFPNADILHPDTAYCVQLTGTPSQTGDFTLTIYITATVDFGGPLRAQAVDDSSLVISVVEALGIEPEPANEFRVFQNIPNPYTYRTTLAYDTPVQQEVELNIYNILGVLVYQESEIVAPGRHDFHFDGTELQPGTYLYRIGTGKTYYSGKLMKSR